jgi:hypothetical protein
MKSAKLVVLLCAIALTLACGYSSKMTPATAGTMPTIQTLNPNSATHGAASFMLTVNGANFNGNATVNWNGMAQTTTFVSGGQLTMAVPASALMSAGSVSVTVTNPGTPGGIYGGGTMAQTSSAMTFMIN